MLLDRIAAMAREAATSTYGHAPADVPLEFPAERSFGDLTLNAFLWARDLRRPPATIAKELAAALDAHSPIVSAEAVKGYVNLRLETDAIFAAAVPALLTGPETYGRTTDHAGLRLMVEFSAPNTNKPQHLGHMRNNFLGDSLALILENAGAQVIKANLFNDRGIHICKSMLAYQEFGEGSTPQSVGRKSDHFVGDFYVLFEQRFQEQAAAWIAAHPEHYQRWRQQEGRDRRGRPLAEDEARRAHRASFREENFALIPLGAACTEMLRQWEEGKPAVRALWEKMNSWAFEGFARTYEDLGISFDRVYRESQTYLLGRDLVLRGLEQGIFSRRSDGAVEIDLRDEKLDRKVVLRADGTSVYITQDIGTTVLKAEENELDGQVWVVGEEQKHHFKILFSILRRMDYSWAGNLHHLAYGMVHLPEGRMKSREGKVVDADDLLEEVAGLAAEEIRLRDPENLLSPQEVRRRARIIGLSALRFMLLKVAPQNEMTFNPAESVKFEGDTGARVLYAYARLRTMVHDAGPEAEGVEGDLTLLQHEAERNLGLDLLAFPRVASRAARELSPAPLAVFLLELVRNLNRFYDRCDVLRERDLGLRRARLLLCRAAAGVVARAAGLLGMPLLDRM